MTPELFYCLLLFLVAFGATVGVSAYLIPFLRKRKAGQPILEIGPAWHLSKAGTPTLGGLAFIVGIGLSALLGAILFALRAEQSALRAMALVLLYALLCGAIGFVDDYKKLSQKQNKGLTAVQKYLLQLLASGLFLFLVQTLLGVDTTLALPFSDTVVDLGIFYYPLALVFLTGIVNALNLTDGVDGLLSSTVAVAAAFLLLWGTALANLSVSLLGSLLLGGMVGFLCFNAHPAKVFMGDTGSLFLGACLAGVGIVTGEMALILLLSGIYVVEAASVILQVVWFKLSGGKRLFQMAPLHHHFEKRGWSEWRVVGVFSLGALAFAALAFLGR